MISVFRIPLLATIQAYEKAKEGYTTLYNRLMNDLLVLREQKQQDLFAKNFQLVLGNISDATASFTADLSEESIRQIAAVITQYTNGKISYEHYQKELTKIAAEETAIRLRYQLNEVRESSKQKSPLGKTKSVSASRNTTLYKSNTMHWKPAR